MAEVKVEGNENFEKAANRARKVLARFTSVNISWVALLNKNGILLMDSAPPTSMHWPSPDCIFMAAETTASMPEAQLRCTV